MKHVYFFILTLTFICSLNLYSAQEGYYRFPTLAGSNIIFTAESDLWIASADGGIAQRLTSHTGYETHAYVSPDGSIIAFSAQYEGSTEVYTMPVQGGLPTRRTFEGENAIVVGWTPDGKILYSSGHYSTLPARQLLTIDLTTGTTTLLPLAQASDGCYDDKGTTLYFTRLPFQGSHTKRYKGGTAQTIWKYASGITEAIPLTSDYTGTSKIPMWWQGRVYFVSDRDGTMNLWSMDENGHDLKQLTTHKGWDVKYPSLNNGKIVYQSGADIYLYTISASTDIKIVIRLASDFDQMRDKWVKKPMDYLTSATISPNGDRVALTARGQVFVAPAEQGRFIQITHNDKVRYRSARFLPDGKSLMVLSDETGEIEFWKYPANGVGKPMQLSGNNTVFRADGIPSPDGKWITYDDKFQRLWLFNIDANTTVQIDTCDMSGFSNIQWSPDSKWIAYDVTGENLIQIIKAYNLDTKQLDTLTSDRVDSYNPVWSSDGKWMYFLSDRFFQSIVSSPWGSREPEPFFDKTTKVYSLSLKKGGRSPFLPSDEVSSADTASSKKGDDKGVSVDIDLDGIQNRITEVPVPPSTYKNLAITDKFLFWEESDVSANPKTKLVSLEIKNKDISPKTILEDITSKDVSLDRKKMIVRKGDDIYVIDASGAPPSDLGKNKVNLNNWTFSVNPHDEWRQMFTEAWRLERDYFYAPNLNGANYTALLQQYLPLVDRVTDRDELSDLITGIVGELSALHTFVRGGDLRDIPDQISTASLGAVLVKDETKGGYVIQHMYQSDPDYPDVSSPLLKPGVSVREGDIIKTINGISTLSVESPNLLLRNQSGQQVLLGLISATSGKEYNAIVKPFSMGDESNLRYTEWEYTRRQAVEKASSNDIGYVHLRAMGGGNYTEWTKGFYPVFNRKGLIIDVRNNRGGNIDSWILEKLIRKAWFYWKPRSGAPTWNMQYAFRGHVVVLCNEFTASDGEAFTEGFRRLGLGKVIGTRTWGGEVWLDFDTYLVDKGIASAAEIGVYGPEGNWLIEGHGVDPDMVVDNLPVSTFGGNDKQLDEAIKYLQEQIRLQPVQVPPPPQYPNKSPDNK